MTIVCPHCSAENRIAGYYRLRSETQGQSDAPVRCVKCGKMLNAEPSKEDAKD